VEAPGNEGDESGARAPSRVKKDRKKEGSREKRKTGASVSFCGPGSFQFNH